MKTFLKKFALIGGITILSVLGIALILFSIFVLVMITEHKDTTDGSFLILVLSAFGFGVASFIGVGNLYRSFQKLN